MEQWRPVVGYEDMYIVSNTGRVMSNLSGLWHELKPQINSCGYYLVNLGHKGHTKRTAVHRIVANAFIPREQGKKQVNHKDGDKLNNHVENLEWCTCSENITHAWRIGLKEKQRDVVRELCRRIQKKGVQVHIQKSSIPMKVTELKTGKAMIFSSANEAARALGLWQGNLSAVANGRIKQTGGYIAEKLEEKKWQTS